MLESSILQNCEWFHSKIKSLCWKTNTSFGLFEFWNQSLLQLSVALIESYFDYFVMSHKPEMSSNTPKSVNMQWSFSAAFDPQFEFQGPLHLFSAGSTEEGIGLGRKKKNKVRLQKLQNNRLERHPSHWDIFDFMNVHWKNWPSSRTPALEPIGSKLCSMRASTQIVARMQIHKVVPCTVSENWPTEKRSHKRTSKKSQEMSICLEVEITKFHLRYSWRGCMHQLPTFRTSLIRKRSLPFHVCPYVYHLA